MLITVKTDPKVDAFIRQIDFFDQPTFAIEIYPAENVELSGIRGAIQALSISLGMGGTFCEFAVDFNLEDRVRVTGNISQAMLKCAENNDSILLFSDKLLSDIKNHKELQEMLLSCEKYCAEKDSSTEEDDDSLSLTSIRNSFKQFKPKEELRDESKENNNILGKNISKAVQGKVK